MSTAAESSSRASPGEPVQLTPCEFEIMEVMWELESATVRQVCTRLQSTRKLAYTTVMTVMDKLHRKGALAQRRKGRAYLYTVRISQAEALRQRIEHLIQHYFQGSPEKFFEYLEEEFQGKQPREDSEEAAVAEPLGPEMDTVLL